LLTRPSLLFCGHTRAWLVERSQAGLNMAFVQFTQPDDQPVVINTERIVTAAPLPPDGQGTRITLTNGGHQDVKEPIADVLRRLNISA
jgi:hypothetical protein